VLGILILRFALGGETFGMPLRKIFEVPLLKYMKRETFGAWKNLRMEVDNLGLLGIKSGDEVSEVNKDK
tara:strand:- start:488 stop:694 length:207 start_codon:yes stop_codon:yes gene_type:complete